MWFVAFLMLWNFGFPSSNIQENGVLMCAICDKHIKEEIKETAWVTQILCRNELRKLLELHNKTRNSKN